MFGRKVATDCSTIVASLMPRSFPCSVHNRREQSMDQHRFDDITRTIGRGVSRRALLKSLLGIGGVAATGAMAHDTKAARRGYAGPLPKTPTPKPNTVPGTDVAVSLPNGSVSFARVTQPGETTITPVAGSSPPIPGGFATDGATFYDVHTTAVFSGTVSVCLAYDPSAYTNPSQVRLLHFEHGNWVDITSGVTSSSVCGTADSLSPFAIVEPAIQCVPPGSTCGAGDICCDDAVCCGSHCVDLKSSDQHCGACGTVCGGCSTCLNGVCAPDNDQCDVSAGEVCCRDGNSFACQPGPYCGECDYDWDCPSDPAHCRLNFCDNGVCSYKQAFPGMLCGECSACNAVGECVQTCAEGEICCGQGLDSGYSACCTEDLCNQNTGVCCDPGYSACGDTCCNSGEYCCGSGVCSSSPCCETDSDCPPCFECNNGICESGCDQYWEQCCPDLDEHGQCIPYNQSCTDPICDTNLCQALENGTCIDFCAAHGAVCDGQGSCVAACIPVDNACGDGDTCCDDNVCCHGVCSSPDSTCGGACCGDDQDCCGYYCVPKDTTCCTGSVQCRNLNHCDGAGMMVWHNFICDTSLGYCVESITDCSNDDPCHPGVCAWDSGCWQDSRSGQPCGDQCCTNCCNGECIDENLTCCTSAADCPAVPNQIAGCSAEHICVYTSACPGCVGLWDNCDGLGGYQQFACEGCTPVICCYDTSHGYQYPRWTPANLSSNYDCSA